MKSLRLLCVLFGLGASALLIGLAAGSGNAAWLKPVPALFAATAAATRAQGAKASRSASRGGGA